MRMSQPMYGNRCDIHILILALPHSDMHSPDWTLSESCQSWTFLLTADENVCDLYSIKQPNLTSLPYHDEATSASFFGTHGYSDEPLANGACFRQKLDGSLTTSGQCDWLRTWFVPFKDNRNFKLHIIGLYHSTPRVCS